MKIGYTKSSSFWKWMKSCGLELTAESGGHAKHFQFGKVYRGKSGQYQIQYIDGQLVLFMTADQFMDTVKRVESKIPYKLFK